MHVFVRQRGGKVFRSSSAAVGVEGLIIPRLFQGLGWHAHTHTVAVLHTNTHAHASTADGKASWGRLAATLLHFLSPSLSLSPEHTAHRRKRARTHARRQAGVEDQTCSLLQAGAAPPCLHF